jgi:hypothetical protein
MSQQLISYNKIRRAIGFIGILLPFALWAGNSLLNNIGFAKGLTWIRYNGEYISTLNLKSSVSHFYYTTMGEVFTGALCAVALFLFCYRGYDKRKADKVQWVPGDNFMANAAAICALGVVIFPTAGEEIKDNFRAFEGTKLTGYIHYGFAALFFIILALMSMVNFRRTAIPAQFGKMPSHPLYLWCGVVMLACMAFLAAIFIIDKPVPNNMKWVDAYSVTYWLETVMLFAFGLSWLRKGKINELVSSKPAPANKAISIPAVADKQAN